MWRGSELAAGTARARSTASTSGTGSRPARRQVAGAAREAGRPGDTSSIIFILVVLEWIDEGGTPVEEDVGPVGVRP